MGDLDKRHTRIRKLARINWRLLLLVILTALLGCTAQFKIRLTILLFLKAELSHRYEIAWKYISERDKEFKTKAEYLKEKEMKAPKNREAALYQEMVDRFTQIRIDSIEIDSNQAKVDAILRRPEVDSASQDSILLRYPNYAEHLKLLDLATKYPWYRDSLLNLDKRLYLDIQREKPLYWKDMQLRLRQLLRRKRAQYHEDTLTYFMIKEGRDWRLFFDWAKIALISKSPTAFIEAELSNDYEIVWENISERDKEFKTKEEYLKEKEMEMAEKNEEAVLYQKMVNRLTQVRIDSIEMDSNEAVVKVILRRPDTDFIKGLVPMDLRKNESLYWRAMRLKLQELIENEEVPFSEDTLTYFLVKEENNWKVFLDWGKLSIIQRLMHEAHKLEERGWKSGNTIKLREALSRYREAVALYTGPCVVLYPNLLMTWEKGKQISIQEKINEMSNKIAYFDKIKLSNLCAQPFSKYLPQYWNITGRITNKGDRDLITAWVIVSILDKYGNTIEKRTYQLLWKGILEPDCTKRFEPLSLLKGPKRFKVRVQNFEFAKEKEKIKSYREVVHKELTEPYTGTIYVKRFSNIREGPGTSYRIVGKAYPGHPYKYVVGTLGNEWVKLWYKGREAYVYGEFTCPNKVYIEDVEWRTEGNYYYIKGELKNISDEIVKYVEVFADFKDKRGKIIDSDWIDIEKILYPGATQGFEIKVPTCGASKVTVRVHKVVTD